MATRRGSARLSSAAAQRRVWFFALLTGFTMATLIRLRGPVDIDTWLHLRIGEELRGGTSFGVVPDPLVVLADIPYVPTQWLSQMIFSMVHDAAGLRGVLALRLGALMLLMAVVWTATRLGGGPVVAAGATFVALVASSAAWAERPQIFGLALHGVVVLVWVRARRNDRVPWLVVPLLWLWACLHGTWVLGLVTGVVFTALKLVEPRNSKRPVRSLLGLNALSVIAIALTPLGPRLLIEPIHVGELATAAVPEWQPSQVSNPLMLLVVGMALVVLWRATRERQNGWADALLAAAAVVLALYTVRTIAFGAVLVAPAFAHALTHASRRGDKCCWREESTPWLVAAGLLAVFPGAVVGFPMQPPVGQAISTQLEAVPSGSTVAVDLSVSGWFLYAHPELKPLRDVRVEIYSPGVVADFDSFQNAGPEWEDYGAAHDVRAFLLAKGSLLSQALHESGRWRAAAIQHDYALWLPVEVARAALPPGGG